MNKNKLTLVTQPVILASLFFSHSNHAETTQLDDLLVTASRIPVSAAEVGGAHTVITQEEIARSKQTFVLDLLRSVPGIAISRSGGIGAQTQARLRGAEADQTLVMIDGIEANDPAQGSGFDFAHLLTEDIERIEILRGPQSSLWGSDAIGGVIHIITKRAEKTALDGGLDAGSFSTLRANFNFQKAAENFGLAVNGNFVRSDGINTSETGNEDDGYRNRTLNVKANASPTKNLDLLFTARNTNSTTQFDPTDFVTSKPVDGDRESDVDQIYTQFRATLDTLDGHWQHVFNAQWTSTDNENFADGIQSTTSDGRKRKLSYQSNVFFNTPALANARHTFVLALEHEKEEFKQTGTASIYGDPNQSQSLTNRGIVGEYRVSLLDQLHATASVRHDNNDAFDNATTWRTSLTWAIPNTGTSVHAGYGTAIKNPSFTERFGYTPDTFFGNPNLEPEESRGWEVGIDQRLLDDRLTASLNFFRDRLENEINGFVFDPNLGGFTAENVSGESERQGVELSLSAEITTQLGMSGMISYVDSTQPDSYGVQERELRRPEITAAFNSWYRFLQDKASINLNITYTDEQFDSDFSTFPATRVTLDDYTLVNIAAEYQILPNVLLYGRVDNLFDEDYQDVFGFETPGVAGYAGFRVNID